MHLTDCKYQAYYDAVEDFLGQPPEGAAHKTDLESLWLIIQLGVPAPPPHDNRDLWKRAFDMWGVSPGSHNDRMYKWLGNMGYTQGTLNDREYEFWCVDGGIPVDIVRHNGEPVTYNGEELTVAELTEILSVGSMRVDVPYAGVYPDDAWVKIGFDTVTNNPPDMDVNPALDSITVNRAGLYKVSLGLNAAWPVPETLGIMVFINDIEYSDRPLILAGEGGTDPISLFWSSYIPLLAGQIIDVRGRNQETGNLNASIERGIFSLEWKDDEAVL